ncbi:5'-AMP-activated protein kinase subunit beta-1-like [Dendronephthya gigantea]|uniref:5'-AMP-activated protein kinase subunit beta-1-like n=1 Tax=Dendronephthya gigantea TaxID=151771 RepID=UPI00106AD54E|nr:5'-AMP-activated protein kinase subunit beta-1-like [Dendronephthya gigantea]
MGQGTSALSAGRNDKNNDSTLEFEPGHKIFAQIERNKRFKANTDTQMDFQSSDESKDNDMPTSSSGTSILPQSVPTVFKWENGGNVVYLSGSFNGWNSRIPMHGSHGEFVTIIELTEGDHEYKFFVDGHWVHDPNAPTTNDNFGGRNNVITVKKSDFEVMEALDDDDRQSGSGIVASSPPGSYAQLIPSHHNPVVIQDGMHASIPPSLPPHLLNVILNKDAIDVNEPSLLQEPHHVSLNHLYALSIKEGVAVLSSTQRYREKYVTTLLYRPIK